MDVTVSVVDISGCTDRDLVHEALDDRLVGPLRVRVEVLRAGTNRVAFYTVYRAERALLVGDMSFAAGDCPGVESSLADKLASALEPVCPECLVVIPVDRAPLRRVELAVGVALGVGETWEPRAAIGPRALWSAGACCLLTEARAEIGFPVDVPEAGAWTQLGELTLGTGWTTPGAAEGGLSAAAGVSGGVAAAWSRELPPGDASLAPVAQAWVMGAYTTVRLSYALRVRANLTRIDRYARGNEGTGHVAEPWVHAELVLAPALFHRGG